MDSEILPQLKLRCLTLSAYHGHNPSFYHPRPSCVAAFPSHDLFQNAYVVVDFCPAFYHHHREVEVGETYPDPSWAGMAVTLTSTHDHANRKVNVSSFYQERATSQDHRLFEGEGAGKYHASKDHQVLYP